MLLNERRVAIHIQLNPMLVCLSDRDLGLRLRELGARLLQLASRLRESAFCLIKVCLKGPGINLEEQLAFPHEGTFRVFLLYEVPRDLRFDFGVDEAINGADPFAVQRDVPLLDVSHQNLKRFGSGCDLCGMPACRRDQKHRAD